MNSRMHSVLSRFGPGLMVAGTVALVAAFLGGHYGAPVMLFALLLGMAFNFLGQPDHNCYPGIRLASTSVLRVGVALLGTRVTIDQIMALGYGPIVAVACLVVLTLVSGLVFARAFGLDGRIGILTGGAVAICGASAAVAIAAVLPRDTRTERYVLLTVIGVTSLSTAAMVLYPVLTLVAGLDDLQTGLFLGASIHDVAQVVGAGYSVSDPVGNVATYCKLLRVSTLLPVVLVLALVFRQRVDGSAGSVQRVFPPFLIAFAVMVVLTSAGVIPPPFRELLADLSRACLIMAVAGLGAQTSFAQLASLGFKPVVLLVVESMLLAAGAMLFVLAWR